MHALAASGVLRSSCTDLLRYLHAQLDPQSTPLADALRAVQRPRVATEGRQSMCLVWNHRRFRFGDVLFHGGNTAGFAAFVGFCPDSGTGVLALTNATMSDTVIQTTYNLLKSLSPRKTGRPPALRQAASPARADDDQLYKARSDRGRVINAGEPFYLAAQFVRSTATSGPRLMRH